MATPKLPRSEAQEPDAKLCWSSGADYAFDKESILAHVPQDSGVYALDHLGIQLFIGESVNLREALLRHYSRRHFQTDHGLPTGFRFEVCSAELRVQKARSLIARFQPVHQSEFVPEKTGVFISDRGVEQADSFDALFHNRFEATAGAAPGGTAALVPQRWFFEGRQLIALGTVCVTSLAVVFYLGVLTGESIQKKTNMSSAKPQAEVAEAANFQGFAATAGASMSRNISPAKTNLQPVERKPTALAEPQVATATKKIAIPPLALGKAKSAVSTPAVPAQVQESKAPAGSKVAANAESAAAAQSGKTWSVQIGAGTAKKAIEDQIARLKSKGYDSYVVEAERDGQTWYRARVGRFGARAEAETLRQALESQEGFKSPLTVSD